MFGQIDEGLNPNPIFYLGLALATWLYPAPLDARLAIDRQHEGRKRFTCRNDIPTAVVAFWTNQSPHRSALDRGGHREPVAKRLPRRHVRHSPRCNTNRIRTHAPHSVQPRRDAACLSASLSAPIWRTYRLMSRQSLENSFLTGMAVATGSATKTPRNA